MQNFTLLESGGSRKMGFTFQSQQEAAASPQLRGALRSLAPQLEYAPGSERTSRVSGLRTNAYPGSARRHGQTRVVAKRGWCTPALPVSRTPRPPRKKAQGCLGPRATVARGVSSSADFSLGVAPQRQKAPSPLKPTLQRLPSPSPSPRNSRTPLRAPTRGLSPWRQVERAGRARLD